MSPAATARRTTKKPAAAVPTPGGYTGQLLRVDLSKGRVWTQPWGPDEMREYLGGVGLGAKILYDEVGPKIGWDHPDNRLILATGPLAGLPVWGTGGLTVVTRGALTNGATSTQANGCCGAVMGAKKLKAVCIVRGTKALAVHDPRGVVQAADDIAHDLKTDPSTSTLYNWGTLPGVLNLSKLGVLPIKNYTTNVTGMDMSNWEPVKLRENFDHRGHQCNACGMRHCHIQVIRDGPHAGEHVDEPEYEGWSGAGWTIGLTD